MDRGNMATDYLYVYHKPGFLTSGDFKVLPYNKYGNKAENENPVLVATRSRWSFQRQHSLSLEGTKTKWRLLSKRCRPGELKVKDAEGNIKLETKWHATRGAARAKILLYGSRQELEVWDRVSGSGYRFIQNEKDIATLDATENGWEVELLAAEEVELKIVSLPPT
jgi:hypothetical protein